MDSFSCETHEFSLLSLENLSIFSQFLRPFSQTLYKYPVYENQALRFLCPLNLCEIHINRSFLVIFQENREFLRGFLEKFPAKLAPLLSISYKKLEFLESVDEISASALVFREKCEKTLKNLEFFAWKPRLAAFLHGKFLCFFDKSQKNLSFCDLEAGKTLKTLSFPINLEVFAVCEHRGQFSGNLFLMVSEENTRKLCVFEVFLDESAAKIVKTIEFPKKFGESLAGFVENCKVFCVNLEVLCGENARNRVFFVVLREIKEGIHVKTAVFNEKTNVFESFFEFEKKTQRFQETCSVNIEFSRVFSNIYLIFDENTVVLYKNAENIEEIQEIEENFNKISEKDAETLINRAFSLKLVKVLAGNIENLANLSLECRKFIEKNVKNVRFSENFCEFAVKFLLKHKPLKLLQIQKFFEFAVLGGNIQEITQKMWKYMDFYDFSLKIGENSRKLAKRPQKFAEILRVFNDFDYIWLFFALSLGKKDFIQDFVVFNTKFSRNLDFCVSLQELLRFLS